MHRRILAAAVVSALIVFGCASPGTPPTHYSADTITEEQIDAYNGDTVYLLIQSLHASWLQERGHESMRVAAPVMVYIDGIPQYDGVDSLKNLRPREVQEIKYLDSRQATARFGTGHSNGAILVTRR
jgi:hypothetical protein